MNEQMMQVPGAVNIPGDSGGTFGSTIAAVLENAMAQAMANPPPPQPAPAEPAAPVGVPVPPPLQAMTPSDRPPSPPQPEDPNAPVVSTDPVGDVTARFIQKQPEVPSATPAPATDPGSEPRDPEDLDPKANEAWKHLKQMLKASRADNDALRKQLEDVSKGAGEVAQERAQFAEAIKQREDHIKELEERVGKLDLTSRPEFREQYDAPIADVVSQVRDVLLAEADLDESKATDIAEAVLTASDSQFNQMVNKLPTAVQGSLLDKRVRYANLNAAREHAVREWRTTQSGVDSVSEQQRVVERATRRRDMAEAAIDFATKLTPPQDRVSVLGEATYADDVKNVTESFRGFMQEAKDEEIARAAYQGFLVPVMQRQVAYLVQALNEMRNYAYALKGASVPPVSAVRVRGAEVSAPPPPPSPVRPGAHFAETVSNTVLAAISNGLPPR